MVRYIKSFFPMKYRKKIRITWFDYTGNETYFVTICTKDRCHYFWKIIEWKLKINELWNFTTSHRYKIPKHYPNIQVWEFICMTNHIHGIISIRWNLDTKNIIQNQPKSWSLGAIIRWYKIWITKYSKEHNIDFKRQWRFYEHIIRDQNAYEKIIYYIKNNPKNRLKDSLHS